MPRGRKPKAPPIKKESMGAKAIKIVERSRLEMIAAWQAQENRLNEAARSLAEALRTERQPEAERAYGYAKGLRDGHAESHRILTRIIEVITGSNL